MGATEVQVKGVFLATGTTGTVPAVLLSLSGGAVIPIYIGLWEAISINNALNHDVLPRPGTHDLFLSMLETFEIGVVGLQIDELREGIFYARLLSTRDGAEESLDCRPSDGIAIALRAGAPISVDDAVAEEAGIDEADLPGFVDLATYLA